MDKKFNLILTTSSLFYNLNYQTELTLLRARQQKSRRINRLDLFWTDHLESEQTLRSRLLPGI